MSNFSLQFTVDRLQLFFPGGVRSYDLTHKILIYNVQLRLKPRLF